MKKLLPIIIAIIVVGSGAFYGGMKYTESKSQDGFSAQRQQRLQGLGASASGFRGGQRDGQGFVAGEIISKDDKSVIVKLQNGGSKIVFFSDATEITKSASGAINDLEVGKNILANGAANSDGSIIAQSIQLRPQQ